MLRWETQRSDQQFATLLSMGRNIALDDHDRSKFKQLLEELNWSQTKLASEADVERHWVNQILLGKRGKRANSDLAERVATTLVGAVKASTGLNPEQKQSFMTFLGRFTKAAPLPPRMYMPGGRVPLDAVHYISRPEEEIFINSALQQDSFGALLTGPVQCGKSSLLWRLAAKATNLGTETVRIDPVSAVPGLGVPGQSVAELGAAVASALGEILLREWRLEAADFPIDGLDRLTPWLISALAKAPKKNRLLIIDDLSEFGAVAMSFLRILVRSLYDERLIGIAIGATTYFDEAFIAHWTLLSTVVPWAPRSELSWFTKDEVRRLASFYPGKSDLADRLYPLTLGQPALTHAALADQSLLAAIEAWVRRQTEENARPIRGAHPYRRYVHALRSSFLNASGLATSRRSEYRRYLGELAAAGKKDSTPNLPAELAAYLQKSCLVSATHHPTILLHKLVFEDLAGTP